MNNRERWHREHMGTFEPPADDPLRDLGRQYHHRCDAWDDENLTGVFVPGEGRMWADERERARSSRVSRQIWNDVVDLGLQMGYTHAQVARAIREAGCEQP